MGAIHVMRIARAHAITLVRTDALDTAQETALIHATVDVKEGAMVVVQALVKAHVQDAQAVVAAVVQDAQVAQVAQVVQALVQEVVQDVLVHAQALATVAQVDAVVDAAVALVRAQVVVVDAVDAQAHV